MVKEMMEYSTELKKFKQRRDNLDYQWYICKIIEKTYKSVLGITKINLIILIAYLIQMILMLLLLGK